MNYFFASPEMARAEMAERLRPARRAPLVREATALKGLRHRLMVGLRRPSLVVTPTRRPRSA